MKNMIWKLLLAAVLVLAVAVLVPSATLVAGAEADDTPCPTFVPVELETVEPVDFSSGTPYGPHEDGYWEEEDGSSGYRDGSISVTIHKMRRYNTYIMVAYVQLADASQMRTELCKPYPSSATAPAANLANRVNATFAISGDSFTHTDMHTGYIVRNGQLLRNKFDDTFDMLVVDTAGDFHIVTPMLEENVAAFEGEIAQTFVFGPALVIDGEVNNDFRRGTYVPTHEAQRMAIGQLDHLSYVIVATEGPENKNSDGLTLYEMADLMAELGCSNAYNLDGGSSSTLVLKGKKVNSLSSGKVRPIGDIIYFVTALPEDE